MSKIRLKSLQIDITAKVGENTMTKVKICGLKEIEHVETAVNSGADFIGFMFAPSKRRITVEEAVELAKAIPNTREKSRRICKCKSETYSANCKRSWTRLYPISWG